MFHFIANHPPEPVRLSFRALIPGHVRQYLKDFQLDAIRFMHKFLAKGEFCVYNDESGLGKQAATVVLLDAACNSRKSLIVVQNDDRYVSGWEFHFKVLTNTNITVIKDDKDSTDSPHTVYIAKWSTLRTIDDLTKFNFDFIVLDNRGQMLNNSFCTSMLLKHYDRKINILISSVDITSDLKLLHNVLRLGGRLDPQYSSFKIFEEKFKLPEAKELAYKRIDLEEYFCKRERLADYCKDFRLRRYCHQFETQLPLVKEDRYKINVELWREKQNATNSESSSIEYVNHGNREEEQIKDTQELFEEYCRQRRKQHLKFQQEEEKRLQQREQEMLKSLDTEKEIIYNVDDEVALITYTQKPITEKPPITRENSDEVVLMSPLMVESDSDVDDTPEICDSVDDIEVVDLASEELEDPEKHNKGENSANDNNKSVKETCETLLGKKSRTFKKRSEIDRLEEDIVDSLKIREVPKRMRRTKYEGKLQPKTKRLRDRLDEKRARNKCSSEKTSTSSKGASSASLKNELDSAEKSIASLNNKGNVSKENRKDSLNQPKLTVKEICTTPKNKKALSNKPNTTTPLSTKLKAVEKEEKSSRGIVNTCATGNSSHATPKRTITVSNVENISKETTAKANNNPKQIKQEVLEESSETKQNISKESSSKVNTEKLRIKRKIGITPPGVHHKQTRSMQRLTRSVGGSKYLTKNLSLQIDKITKPKKIHSLKGTPKRADENNKEANVGDSKKVNINKTVIEDKPKTVIKNTQTSIISHRSSQDYESLQCAQRLSDVGVFDNGIEKNTEFLMPAIPNSLLPSSLQSSTGVLTESEIIFIPPSNSTTQRKREQVILLSSSDNENSTSQSSTTNISMTSRRTRALKPKRIQQQSMGESNKIPSFTDLLANQNTRVNAKSPDLFSNCSDLIQLPCTQPNVDNEEPNAPFEGFKIFGSEVKQMQQHYAFNKNNNTGKQDIHFKKTYREQRSCLDILENMFDPSNTKMQQLPNGKLSTITQKSCRSEAAMNKQKIHTQILPSHPVDAITEARQQQELQKRKRSTVVSLTGMQDDDIFEITNNGTFGSILRLHSNGDISPVQNPQKVNAKQHNKITNYLIGSAIPNGSQEEAAPQSGNSCGNFNMEAGTPSKRHQQLCSVQNNNVKKSPKGKCNTTQATKLTKWFTKPSELSRHESTTKSKFSNSKKIPKKQVQSNQEVDLSTTTAPSSPSASGKRVLKRRRLDLSFNK